MRSQHDAKLTNARYERHRHAALSLHSALLGLALTGRSWEQGAESEIINIVQQCWEPWAQEDHEGWAVAVADALGYAHDGNVIHRDVKPGNMVLETGHAVVADCGIARAVTEAAAEKLTETRIAVGTPSYINPEQAPGERDLDGRSDVYSLRCVLHEMLIGLPPQRYDPIRDDLRFQALLRTCEN